MNLTAPMELRAAMRDSALTAAAAERFRVANFLRLKADACDGEAARLPYEPAQRAMAAAATLRAAAQDVESMA